VTAAVQDRQVSKQQASDVIRVGRSPDHDFPRHLPRDGRVHLVSHPRLSDEWV
jgi:hypothetical protein